MTAMAEPISPTENQLAWQRLGLGVFAHFGVNTYFAKEWSDGSLPASSFNPVDFDADSLIRQVKSWGAKYFVLTAKHHDGFCLWPTQTTSYSVQSSPWREGTGDVVGEIAAACQRHGIGLGLYLSPWDRNSEHYSDEDAYNTFYLAQLLELCTQYGPLMELWFDGAGSEGRSYDWAAIASLIDEHQPDAMVFNMGRPTIRWVGNEDGLASDPVEYVVNHTKMSNYTVVTAEFSEALYLPPECDVSIRRGWFWRENDAPKSLEHLLGIYYRSVGLGAGLLLNVPPNDRGTFDPEDAARMVELRTALDQQFGSPLPAVLSRETEGVWVARFTQASLLDHLELSEGLNTGQRIHNHRVYADGVLIADGGTVGVKRLHVFPSRDVTEVRIEIDGDGASLEGVIGYNTGIDTAPTVPEDYRAPTEEPLD